MADRFLFWVGGELLLVGDCESVLELEVFSGLMSWEIGLGVSVCCGSCLGATGDEGDGVKWFDVIGSLELSISVGVLGTELEVDELD